MEYQSLINQSINLSTHANQAVKNGPSHPRRRYGSTRQAGAPTSVGGPYVKMDGGCNQRNIIGLKQDV
jgi:hypothetical protein